MASAGEIFFAVLLFGLVLIGSYLVFIDGRYLYYRYKTPHTFGVNGMSGDKLKLSCDLGTINIEYGTYGCGENLPACDYADKKGSFNPSTTKSAINDLEAACKGKKECTFTVPANGNMCASCPNNSTLLFGGYTCQV